MLIKYKLKECQMQESMRTDASLNKSNKKFMTTWLLSLLLGVLGVDRFYLGKIVTGILKLLTFGGLGIWYLIDLIFILTNSMKDKKGYDLEGYTNDNKKIAIIITIIYLVLSFIGGFVSGLYSADATKTSNIDLSANSVEEKTESVKFTEDLSMEKKEPNVPPEYKSALNQAKSYTSTMKMSKQGVYDQLISEYGGKFSEDAAKYATDNIKVDYNANALSQAKTYQEQLNQSPNAIRDQLVSEYGAKFTDAEADYAMAHLND